MAAPVADVVGTMSRIAILLLAAVLTASHLTAYHMGRRAEDGTKLDQALAYNIGPGAFCGSTLVKRLNAEDYPGACREILRWNRAGGRVVQGLVNRREAEYRQCIGAQP